MPRCGGSAHQRILVHEMMHSCKFPLADDLDTPDKKEHLHFDPFINTLRWGLQQRYPDSTICCDEAVPFGAGRPGFELNCPVTDGGYPRETGNFQLPEEEDDDDGNDSGDWQIYLDGALSL